MNQTSSAHLRLVVADDPAVEFDRWLGRSATAFALCDRRRILCSNEAFAALGIDTAAASMSTLFDCCDVDISLDWPGTASLTARSTPWGEAAERLLLEVRPASSTRSTSGMQLDPVTGLLERATFEPMVEARVAQALGDDSALALFHIDFPRFDDIRRGTETDLRLQFLCETGRRLAARAEPDGFAARVESARFAILLPAPDGPDGATREAERLRKMLANFKVLSDGTEDWIHPRIGYALMPEDTSEALAVLGGAPAENASGDKADAAASLSSSADLAVEHALLGKDAPTLRFTPALVIARQRREDLARDVVDAVDEGQMHVVFQPVMDIATMHLAGFEALLRWRHPAYGPVPPQEAIAIAERSGALCALTRHVMDTTVARCLDWPDHLTFAVNVTPTQLNGHLVRLIEDVLARHALPPERLEIEVTEDALIRDVETSANVINTIRRLGVRVAMDDFGAGFTSLSNLKRLTFDKIKIDRSLCAGLGENDRTVHIVGGLVRLAERLEIAATIEGIETPDQLAALEGLPCLVQGYVFSPPVPASGMDAFKPLVGPQRSRPAAVRAAS